MELKELIGKPVQCEDGYIRVLNGLKITMVNKDSKDIAMDTIIYRTYIEKTNKKWWSDKSETWTTHLYEKLKTLLESGTVVDKEVMPDVYKNLEKLK
ncbi:MAG: hypothetical protein AMQ74_01919 [Candidatus Methanofastidiosum methylothiophilum]|uniref:Uncharacterized protein n=1 Tax=Candidatus Methanofastidiosum methylothiophilum TaxID=1705564 RepID=A0A150IJF6_9EURY|nr:MAG: hypothetical protein AMQ74_01919 [Candidatus Methanofastidiosum methylthiophilus]